MNIHEATSLIKQRFMEIEIPADKNHSDFYLNVGYAEFNFGDEYITAMGEGEVYIIDVERRYIPYPDELIQMVDYLILLRDWAIRKKKKKEYGKPWFTVQELIDMRWPDE